MNTSTTLAALLITASILSMQTAMAAPKSKKETIVIEGTMGIIKEQRIKSVQSTVTYVPSTGVAYNLIDISDSGADGFNEHIEAEEITIPSWTLFSW